MLDEEVHLPRQLLDVEGDLRGAVGRRQQLLAPRLQHADERHGLAIQRFVLGQRAGAKVRLQRDVAEILEREDAERVRMAENVRAPAAACARAAARR